MRLTELPIQKIAVLRALKLGDFLVATPAFRALKAAFPEARIDYVGLPWAKNLVLQRYCHYFSGFIVFPGFPGLSEQPWKSAEVTNFLQYMQQQKYDLALQMHGRGEITNICVALWGARTTAGFAPPKSAWLDKPWFMECPEEQPEAGRLLSLLEHCGIPSLGKDLVFPVEPADEQELASVPVYGKLASPYVCVHPGAVSSRPWPTEYFAAVADNCADMGYMVAITGIEAEKELVEQVARQMRHKAYIFAGETSLGALAVLIRGATLYLGNDTGASHLAAAVGTPAVIIFSTGDPKRWAPFNTIKHQIILWDQATPVAVAHKIRSLLEQQGGQL